MGVLHSFWEDYVTNIATNLTETEQQRESFMLPLPSRQDFVNWIAKDMNYLKNHLDIIENLFHVRGIITANDPSKVRNNKLLKKLINSVKYWYTKKSLG